MVITVELEFFEDVMVFVEIEREAVELNSALNCETLKCLPGQRVSLLGTSRCPIIREAWHKAGQLNATQQLVMRDVRPREELYDVNADPHEIKNLADDPKHAKMLKEMRHRLVAWMERTNDKGRTPESARMFESDMAVYLNTLRKRSTPEHVKLIERNIAIMKKWAAEGK